jgi:CubicO group peptidase (beta-lactamase class C family)
MLTGAAGLALGMPKEALAALTPQNTVCWFGKSHADHSALVDKWAAKGFRSISVSIYGDAGSPTYAAVMTLRPQIVAERQFYAQTRDQLQATFNDQASKGFGPYILSATGSVGSQVYCTCFRPMNPIPLTRLDLADADFQTYNNGQHQAGNVLLSFDAFGDPDSPHFAAVWVANPNRFAWACTNSPDDQPTSQQRFDAQWASWSRPQDLTMSGPGRSVVCYTESGIGAVTCEINMTGDEFQAKFNSEAAAGRMPLRVSGAGSGSDARYAAIFTGREEVDPIQPVRSNGPVKDANIDNAVAAFMTAENIKGFSLAVCLGTKLVYARGYTNAEAWYPDVAPTTSFRQASISKFFTAASWWRLFQTRKDVTLQTKVQDILHLTPPPAPSGQAPFVIQPTFKDITLQHLLESCSGLDQGKYLSAPAVADFYGSAPPGNTREMMSWIACLPNPGTPGDKSNVVYGNIDYSMLGLALMTLLGTKTVDDAIRQTILNPLGIGPSTRGSRTRLTDQPPGEARYHLRSYNHNPNAWQLDPLNVSPTVMTAAEELAADQYGAWAYETFVGGGGLSASAIDVARLAACLSCQSFNPLYTQGTIDSWMLLAAIATSTSKGPPPGPHGYHGLDWVATVDLANKIWAGSKGGWLPSHQSIVNFQIGSFTIVYLWNGNTPPDPPKPANGAGDYLNAVGSAVMAKGANLSSTDLFPSYQMASFGASPFKLVPLKAFDLKAIEAQQIHAFAAARRAPTTRRPKRPTIR